MDLCYEEGISQCFAKLEREFECSIDQSVIQPILKYGKCREFSKGDLIVAVGAGSKKIYLIVEGIVRSFYLDFDGNAVTKYFMMENDLCNSESLFLNGKSIEGFEALENVKAIEFPAKIVKEYILSNECLKNVYIRSLEESLIYKMKRESSFQLKSATERYIDFRNEYKELEERISQNIIASYLGMTPVSLSRIRRMIREEGR